MTRQVPFIGRDQELAVIDKLVKDNSAQAVVCISGSGGIGKTRLLQEVGERYAERSAELERFVAKTIDFDDVAVQGVGSLSRRIVKVLGDTHFEPYLRAIKDWRKMESVGVSTEKLNQEAENIHAALVDGFNSLSSQQRIVLRFDTFEAINDPEIVEHLMRLTTQFRNYLIIIAGRNTETIAESIAVKLNEGAVRLIMLRPMNKESSQEYLQEKEDLLHISMPKPLQKRLLVLSKGLPIIIDLAAEAITRNIPMEWLIESDLEELKNASEDRLDEFRAMLVKHIAETRTYMDSLFLALSHVYPLNAEMIQVLLGISNAEASALMREAMSYASVKTLPDQRITLHDEVRWMVNEYAWPQVGASDQRRRDYSDLVAGFFKERLEGIGTYIEHLDESPQFQVDTFLERDKLLRAQDTTKLQLLGHTLNANSSEGVALYEQFMSEARNMHRLRFARKLHNTMRTFYEDLDPDSKYRVDIVYTKFLNDLGEGRAQEAKELLLKLLHEYQDVPQRKAEIYNLLGASEVALGNFGKALEYEEQCLELLYETKSDNYIPTLKNYIGYIYRLRGDWDQSIDYYYQALNAILQLERPNRGTMAGILNNLGYALGLEGKYVEAENYCKQAMEIWQNAGQVKDVLRAKNTLAIIWRDQARYDESIELFSDVISRCREPGDYKLLVSAHFNLAWAQWFQGVAVDSREELIQARDNFETALQLSQEYRYLVHMPGILHQSSNVYWLLQDKEKARQVNDQAYELSKELHDIRYAIDSLLGWAEFDVAEDKYEDIPDYAKLLKEEYEDKGYHYPLFYGRMRRIQGEIAFEQENYEVALVKYARGIAEISQHGGYGMYYIDSELDKLTQKIDVLSPMMALKWSSYLKEYWSENAFEDKVGALVSWCDKQIVRAKLRL
jgi:tetratricopeptide (TPR) repeat protein/uncharacterized membrane-anchored protein YhcB (DUF1043 family)